MQKIFDNVTLIDGTGAAPLEQARVIVDGQNILAAGRAADIPLPIGEIEHWDLAGYTLLPGLIDSHVHIMGSADLRPRPERQPLTDELFTLRTARHARETLEAGFTTVRDMAAPNEPIFALRKAVAEGLIAGPRIVASGQCLTITGGHGTEYGSVMYWEVDNAQEFLNAVRKQWRAGADFIKIIGTESTLYPVVPGRVYFSAEEMQAGVDEAHAVGLKVAAHANTHPDGLRNAVQVGVDTIEHGYPASDDLLAQMAERGIILIPTLAVYHQIKGCVERGELLLPPPVANRLQRVYEQVLDTARRAHKLGVKIALGTDAGNPSTYHGDSALEGLLLAEAGLSAMDVIVAATKTAAEACDRDKILGTIEKGKLADLILVDGDPLEDLALLRDKKRIKLVMQGGVVAVNRGLTPQPQTQGARI